MFAYHDNTAMNTESVLLEVRDLSFSTPSATIIDTVSFCLHSGQITCLIGPNGAGKTTLVRMILNLQQPSSGQIIRRKNLKCAYVPQQFTINPLLPMRVSDFLDLSAGRHDDYQNEIIDRLALHRHLETPLHQCSGGELQCILLARAVLQRPELLILDEPNQGVDIHGQAELYEIIEDIRQGLNCAILMVSHDLHVVMAKADTVLCLNRHICCHGAPVEVSKHPEYIGLFGKAHTDTLAIYNHSHDHHHHLDGTPQRGHCNHD